MTTGCTTNEASFAAFLLRPNLPCPAGLKTWNGSDPAARMAVYRNNVVSSLIDALAETFPVVQALVGEEFFRAMASVFVRQAPPQSRILANYGEGFPEFVERFEPAQSVPYLPDMARLELARVRAYHAADVGPVANEVVGLALASGERIGELCIACHPSVAIVRSAFAVVSLWAAHQVESDDLGAIDPGQPEDAIVLRDGLAVLVMALPSGTAEFVTAISSARNLGVAAATAAGVAPAFDLSATLALLLRHGALTSIHLPRRHLS